ncbi:MAG: hypothetical protein H8E05_00180 [Bacteroidetes bacterium]|nr:hypothetical protein [Bacteroidota bacterium]
MTTTLKFGEPNAKLKALAKKLNVKLKTFSLPSGWTCPAAKECLSKANRETGKIQDGPDTKFRCFQASAEAVYPSLRKAVWHNFDLIKKASKDGVEAVADLICESLPKKFDVMRVHVGGDYFSKKYLQAWVIVATRNPGKLFYSYSKSLHFFADVARPENLVLTASRGGKYDELIDLHGWKEALVVYSEEEAAQKGLEIDHDDSHAAFGAKSFALLLHGTQPKGSEASTALSALRKAGKGGYN